MIFKLLLILPIYIGIFVIFYRPHYIIKMSTSEIGNAFFEFIGEEVNKREFLIDKIKSGEVIFNSKTPWTEERLGKAFDKVIEKLYSEYQNPPPVKINREQALELGKTHVPMLIDMYVEGMEGTLEMLPYFGGKYKINVEKLKSNISANKLFCDNLAIKMGSKIIEQMGENSLASMTLNAIEKRKESSEAVLHAQVIQRDSSENKQDELVLRNIHGFAVIVRCMSG